jgi:hypothetical protein
VHRSSKAADAVKEISEKAIITPVVTRWNSQYDSIRRILEIGNSKLSDICQALDLPKFKSTEMECLQEYVAVMGPVAIALDKLQGEKDAFFGNIMPTLVTVQQKLTGMLNKNLKHAEPLVSALLNGLDKRFREELAFTRSAKDKIIASVAHPYFKLRWIPENKREQCRELFTQAVKCISTQASNSLAGKKNVNTLYTVSKLCSCLISFKIL